LPLFRPIFSDQPWNVFLGEAKRLRMLRAVSKDALPAPLFEAARDHILKHIKDRAVFLGRSGFHLRRKGGGKD
jgi:hypothetical protein